MCVNIQQWDLVTLTQNYLKLLLHYLREGILVLLIFLWFCNNISFDIWCTKVKLFTYFGLFLIYLFLTGGNQILDKEGLFERVWTCGWNLMTQLESSLLQLWTHMESARLSCGNVWRRQGLLMQCNLFCGPFMQDNTDEMVSAKHLLTHCLSLSLVFNIFLSISYIYCGSQHPPCVIVWLKSY